MNHTRLAAKLNENSDIFDELTNQQAADLINLKNIPELVPGSFLTERGILYVLGGLEGDAFMNFLKKLSDGTLTVPGVPSSLYERIYRIMMDVPAGGIDFGTAEMQGQMDLLRQIFPDDFTESMFTKLRAASRKMVGLIDKWELNAMQPCTAHDIYMARELV